MARLDAEPVNTPNPTLQAKLDTPAPTVPAPEPPPASPEPVAPTIPESAPPAPPAEPVQAALPDPDPVPAAKWTPTGNPSLDTIGALFDEKGVDGSTALEEFTKHGEISQETYDDLVKTLGVNAANLVHSQFERAVGELKTAAKVEADKIFAAVGGEESWKQVAAWSKSAALTEDERTEYNSLLKAGGKAAQLVAKELKERMMADPTFKARADLLGSGSTPAGNGAQAPAALMDRATYSAKIREAESRGDRVACENLRKAALHAKASNPYWKIGNPK